MISATLRRSAIVSTSPRRGGGIGSDALNGGLTGLPSKQGSRLSRSGSNDPDPLAYARQAPTAPNAPAATPAAPYLTNVRLVVCPKSTDVICGSPPCHRTEHPRPDGGARCQRPPETLIGIRVPAQVPAITWSLTRSPVRGTHEACLDHRPSALRATE